MPFYAKDSFNLSDVPFQVTDVGSGQMASSVIVAQSILPTLASTSALQTTGNTSLAAAVTALQLLDDIVSGVNARVVVNAALPAGTNLLGNVGILFATGGITSAQTQAVGTGWTTFASQACVTMDIVNYTGVDIEYRRGGAGSTMRVLNNSARTIDGITNANQIGVRRVDQSNTQVTVAGEWLA